ncbi:NAD(P)-dependent alcohol dehydrogenase [Hymenobacter sp. UV11]|uniref:NAD(P)-dependent alcohol dehydrogenase n=1 Tax=Hymenobacter sp. UV11 TaxID=1849735 RepID=UPI00105BC7AD|nr:NAD(P)-dependent alcohol dehydrogenase [Hymenobacter sp. UV11]TDN35851.1 hydroxyacid dehydrogenase [Hymenobacter sp. UV11]TFZ67461.1 NAD(P)-dependent alcohol dehydrogenase [Hymenobacter sp. UV11]
MQATIPTKAYGASGSIFNGLKPMDIERNPPQADEIHIDILYCGVCHSDLHQVKNDWHNTIYPCVPGHEVVGRVDQIGSAVTKFKVGDIVGVGCMVDSCGVCPACKEKEENYCEGPVSWTATYNGYMKPENKDFNTFGGYSTNMTVKESFALKIPATLDIKAAAPILCAGITTYSPLKYWNVGPGQSVAVVGIGGLGHMAVQLARALGATVTAVTRDEKKREAAEQLGAHEVLISTDADSMKAHELKYDFILITIPDMFDVNDYVKLAKRNGIITTVGLLGPYKLPLNNMEVALHRRTVAGSVIGGIAETQEVLDFCAEHHILPEVEMIKMQDINVAFDKMMDEEVRFRYVIDMQSLKDAE